MNNLEIGVVVDLKSISGLPVALNLANSELHFYVDLGNTTLTSVRTVGDLEDAGVLYMKQGNRGVGKERRLEVLYWMYQNVLEPKDDKNPDTDWRFNLTVLRPGVIPDTENELNKTTGHRNADDLIEIHQVLYGKAIFYMQKMDDQRNVTAARYVVAGAGDIVSIPPGWWHVTINIGDTPMVMSDIPRYASGKRTVDIKWGDVEGAAYRFVSSEEEEGWTWITNEAYQQLGKTVARLKKVYPNKLKLPSGIPFDDSLTNLYRDKKYEDMLNYLASDEYREDLLKEDG